MNFIRTFPIVSQVTLCVLLVFIGLYSVLIFAWQIMVLKGRSIRNPDGSVDDWHEQKIFFGVAFADIFVACPAAFAGITMILVGFRGGFFLLSLVGFWFVWANTMTTVNSLRFEKPKITLSWLFTFPAGILVGAGYLLWIIVHYEQVII